MLKFKNRNCVTGREVICKISMQSVQGGVEVQMDVEDDKGNEEMGDTILLTPMDAACFVYEVREKEGACMPVGHSTKGTGRTLGVSRIVAGREWVCVGCAGHVTETIIYAGEITMAAPRFAVDSMALAIESMMVSLMYPSTGDMEEEFG